jgi:CDGSH iron-sulfur domain-containing protein 3
MGTDNPIRKTPYVLKAEKGKYFWCACGKTANGPFCDGSHAGTGIKPLAVEITEERTVAWCGCRKTKNPPFCDGSHATL